MELLWVGELLHEQRSHEAAVEASAEEAPDRQPVCHETLFDGRSQTILARADGAVFVGD